MTQPLDVLDRQRDSYLSAAKRHHDMAVGALTLATPDYSLAATSCHRAYQLVLQARALDQLRQELTEMHQEQDR